MITRRQFIASSAAAYCMPNIALAGSTVNLRAEPITQKILPDREPTKMLGFNGSMPGPTIRSLQGETLSVAVENELTEGTGIHWHGIRLNNAMDGVPLLTQDFIYPKTKFDYSFVPPDAGTFWYHSHYISNDQVARGMLGPLIIEEPTPPDVDLDIVALLFDWVLEKDGSISHDIGNMHDAAHAGQIGNVAKAFLPDVKISKGQRIRLRIINGAVDRIFPIGFGGLSGKVVAIDGMPLKETRDIDAPVLAPAQRMDIIADVQGDLEILLRTRTKLYVLGKILADGERPARDKPIPVLPPNHSPTLGNPNQELKLVMMGGAMGSRHDGVDSWAFNNVSEMRSTPFASFKRGETAKISLINDTAFSHGIHLHGHHFYEVDDKGQLGDYRDTSLVMPRQSRDILCVFDNPGRWMLHCHMLNHQASGMKTWVEVV